MDTFPTQRYETKIENFEICMIDDANEQQNISETITSQAFSPKIEVENQENDTNLNLYQQQHDLEEQDQQDQINQTSQIQSDPQSVTLTPIRLPSILDGEFFKVIRVEDTNITVQCSQCQRYLNGSLKSTGNFLSHIKRLHPLTIDKIKCKSNQRKPATIYIDLSAEKYPEVLKTRKGYRRCNKTGIWQPIYEETYDQFSEWSEGPLIRKRKTVEAESSNHLKISHNNSFVVEDEFDAIGTNVAAKLRNMKLDQRIIAEKLINDILFEAQLGNLHSASNIHV